MSATTTTTDTGASASSHSATFWSALKDQTGGKNTVGRIIFGQAFVGKKNGALTCCASAYGGGHQIVPCECKLSKMVYYLAYESYKTVVANRADFEGGNSKCEFFLTYPLTGCRFVLTKTQVLHIANNVNQGAMSQVEPTALHGSSRRTIAENQVLGNKVERRRLSYTNFATEHDDDQTYSAKNTLIPENTAIVLGMNLGGNNGPLWKYMFLIQPPVGKTGSDSDTKPAGTITANSVSTVTLNSSATADTKSITDTKTDTKTASTTSTVSAAGAPTASSTQFPTDTWLPLISP
jgi:hypothetical protein